MKPSIWEAFVLPSLMVHIGTIILPSETTIRQAHSSPQSYLRSKNPKTSPKGGITLSACEPDK